MLGPDKVTDLLPGPDPAEIDANFILAAEGGIVEVQATGEERPFSRQELDTLLDLAEAGCAQLFEMQMAAVKSAV